MSKVLVLILGLVGGMLFLSEPKPANDNPRLSPVSAVGSVYCCGIQPRPTFCHLTCE